LNNIDALIEWLKAEQALTDAVYFRGPWVEDDNNRESYLVSLGGSGGGGSNVFTRKQNIRVIILGPVDGNTQSLDDIAAQTLRRTLSGDYTACSIAQIEIIGGIIGPGITTENRPWCELNFQVITN
jgi:hypothetical protein